MRLDIKILIIILVIIATWCSSASPYDLNEYYPLSQGSSWEYIKKNNNETKQKKYKYKIEGTEIIDNIETARLFEDEHFNEYVLINVDSEGVKLYKKIKESSYKIFNPSQVVLPNLEIGEEKTYSLTIEEYDMSGIKIGEITASTSFLLESAVADIEVPAGKFEYCLKFSVYTKWFDSHGDYGKEESTIWFAKDIGLVSMSKLATTYHAEKKKEKSEREVYELISAFVNGRQIGHQ